MASSRQALAFDTSRYPRTYVPSLGNRVFWILFGALLTCGGAILGWQTRVAGDELGLNGPPIIGSLSLALVILGGYLISSMLVSKIILKPDAVEVRSLLSRRTMFREEIRGRRFFFNSGTIELLSRGSEKKLKIPFLMKSDGPFTAWFESIPDLDAIDPTQGLSQQKNVARSQASQPSAVSRRTIGVIAVVFIFGPYLFLAPPNIPQAAGRMVVLAIWAFAVPIAVFWFGLKAQMIGPGGKLYQAKYDGSRPKVERNMRLAVLGFGIFYLLTLSLPIGEDLTRVAATRGFFRVRASVVNIGRSSYRSVSINVRLSNDSKSYYVFYPSKPLKIGQSYEFVLLPRSRMILDYNVAD